MEPSHVFMPVPALSYPTMTVNYMFEMLDAAGLICNHIAHSTVLLRLDPAGKESVVGSEQTHPRNIWATSPAYWVYLHPDTTTYSLTSVQS